MSDRDFELPANPSLEYYRKQAKRLLHEFAAGEQEAAARVAETLGDRATERFLLSDAQVVLAQEHRVPYLGRVPRLHRQPDR